MKADTASHTADGAAAMRAAGTYIRDPALRNPDTLAERLLSPRLKRLVGSGLMRAISRQYYGRKLPGMYEAHLARTHFYDGVVRAELEAGAEQYVVLGAGLDSRAYRFAGALGEARVFEVDHPATSAFKRERLASAGVDASHVTFVEVNFGEQSTEERLKAAGFDPSKRTFVTWEGVIMYLDEDTVRDVFGWVASLGAGSSIVFDYTYPDFHENPDKYRHARRHLRYVARVDEPYTFGLAYDAVGPFVADCGLELAIHLNAEEMTERFLAGHGVPVMPWYAVAHARKATSA